MVETRSFLRATEPHFPSLATALSSLLTLQGLLWFDKGSVFVTADFASTTNPAVQAIVDAAPVTSEALTAKAMVDQINLVERAAYLTLLDAINVERARHGAQAITKPQFIQAVKDRVETA
jgi:hypothetical protein